MKTRHRSLRVLIVTSFLLLLEEHLMARRRLASDLRGLRRGVAAAACGCGLDELGLLVRQALKGDLVRHEWGHASTERAS